MERIWLLTELIPETGERKTERTQGNAAVLVVLAGLAENLTEAHHILDAAWDEQLNITLLETPTKYPGSLSPLHR